MDLGLAIQKTIVGIRISILDIPCVPIFSQNEQLWIFRPKFVLFQNKNQHCWDTLCANFQPNWTTLTFLAQICPKRKLGFEIQKTNVGIRISILEILGAPIFRQNGQLWIFGPKFAQKWILGSEFQKSKSGFGINTSNIPCVPIFSQNGQLLIFRPKFGKIAQLRAIFWFKYCWGCCR